MSGKTRWFTPPPDGFSCSLGALPVGPVRFHPSAHRAGETVVVEVADAATAARCMISAIGIPSPSSHRR